MSGFRDALRGPAPLLLDGGLGSLLIAAGLPRGVPPETWVLERPEAVATAHRAYAEAGSHAVQTCTFGAHPLRLERFGLADRCEEIAGAAVELARGSGARFVVGDVGPTGEYLPPVGTGDAALWRRGFERLGRAFADAGADALHVETMSDRREALDALEALREAAPGLPVMVSLTFERKKRGFFTVMGDPLAASLEALRAAGADAVGANCTLASADFRDLARAARAAVDGPLVLQPNAGQPIVEGTGTRYDQDPEAFAADMVEVVALGASAVGGCCGTDPRFIGALAARLAARRGHEAQP